LENVRTAKDAATDLLNRVSIAIGYLGGGFTTGISIPEESVFNFSLAMLRAEISLRSMEASEYGSTLINLESVAKIGARILPLIHTAQQEGWTEASGEELRSMRVELMKSIASLETHYRNLRLEL
jgi:hypothetical protein